MPFEIADDPGTDYRELVRSAYDRCAEAYAGQRRTTAGPELDWLTGRLPAGSRVLDVGCGAGVPVAAQLAADFSVTGIDISPKMTALAGSNVPAARFVTADATEIEFPPGSFDAIVSFYAIPDRAGRRGGRRLCGCRGGRGDPSALPGTELERRAAIAGRL